MRSVHHPRNSLLRRRADGRTDYAALVVVVVVVLMTLPLSGLNYTSTAPGSDKREGTPLEQAVNGFSLD